MVEVDADDPHALDTPTPPHGVLRVWVHGQDDEADPEPLTHQYAIGAGTTACCGRPLLELPLTDVLLRVGPVAARHARPCASARPQEQTWPA